MALALGVLVCDRVGAWGQSVSLFMGLLALLLAVTVLLHKTLTSYRYRWVFGVVMLVTIVWLGYVRTSVFQVTLLTERQNPILQGEKWRLARVLEPPEEREKTVKVLLALESVRTDNGLVKASGKVMAYFQKEDQALRLNYGDLIAFSVPLEEVPPPKNPMEFDYKKYLERKGVTWRVYLQSDKWLFTGTNRTNPIFAFAYRFRQRLLTSLQRCGITDDEFGVAAAILLGDDESLPAQVRQNYVAAGSMHILCVSGMHVGIIYLLASFLLGFLGNGKRMAVVRRMALLFLIWFYALLTGLSPSIMRAALMISFVVFGELIHRKGFALNSIAASAFVLLLINPNNLFAIGFQLSYVAVIGIVLLQRPIYHLLYINNKVLDKIWEITAVSLAAQVATLPLTIYYFNQFTPYFWLSNLLMTPLSFIVILTGMLLLVVSWVPWVNLAMGRLVWWCLHGMNWIVAEIEHWPLSLVKGLYMNDLQFTLSLLLLLLLWLFVNLKRKRMVMEMLVLSVIFAFSMAWQSQQRAHQSRLVVYSLRNHTAIGVVDGFDHVLLCDKGLFSESSIIDYSLKGHWAEEQLTMNPRCHALDEDIDDDLVLKRGNLLSIHGLLFALWDENHFEDGLSYRLPVDYLLVMGRQRPDISSVFYSYAPQTLLIDGSVPRYLAEQWEAQAKGNGLPYVDIGENAFEIK